MTTDLTDLTKARKRRHLARIQAGIQPARRVDATPAIAHLHKLRRCGMSVRSIAHATGVAPQTLSGLIWENHVDHRAKILSTTEAAILDTGFTVEGLDPAAKVSAIGVRRRIQALATKGSTP